MSPPITASSIASIRNSPSSSTISSSRCAPSVARAAERHRGRVADAALAVSRGRLGAAADRVEWITGNIVTVDLGERRFDLWHDRAVFHFLVDEAQRSRFETVQGLARDFTVLSEVGSKDAEVVSGPTRRPLPKLPLRIDGATGEVYLVD